MMEHFIEWKRKQNRFNKFMITEDIVRDYDLTIFGEDNNLTENNFIEIKNAFTLNQIIQKQPIIYFRNEKNETCHLQLNKLFIHKPIIETLEDKNKTEELTPFICKTRKLTYKVGLYVTFKINEQEQHELNYIGSIPLIVGSKYFNSQIDEDDIPGYFIINGTEYCISHVQRHRQYVPIYKFRKRTKMFVCFVSTFDSKFEIQLQTKKNKHGVYVVINGHFLNGTFHLFDVLKILNNNKFDLNEYFTENEIKLIQGNYNETCDLQGIYERIKVIIKKKQIYYWNELQDDLIVQNALNHNLLSFLGNDNEQKIFFILHCVKGLLSRFYEKIPLESQESLQYKTVTTPSFMLELMLLEVFKDSYNNFALSLQTNKLLEKTKKKTKVMNDDLEILWNKAFLNFSITVEKYMNGSKAWVNKLPPPMRLIKRNTNQFQIISLFTQINIPIDKDNPDYTIRQIDGSFYGFICPADTPEGGNRIGVNIHPGFSCIITSHVITITQKIENEIKLHLKTSLDYLQSPLLFLNMRVLGSFEDFNEILTRCKEIKRNLYPYLSIYYRETKNLHMNPNNIYLDTSEGRMMRPLIKVSSSNSTSTSITFEDKIKSGEIEWIDPREQNLIYICSHKEVPKDYHTHQELHDSFLFSQNSGSIPLLNHDKSARNQLAAGMRLQEVGHPFLNSKRTTTDYSYHLYYPQKPISTTIISKAMNVEEQPCTTNCICMVYTLPHNQEDAIIVSRSFLERGGFRIFAQRTYEFIIKKPEILGIHHEHKKENLDVDGLIQIGTIIQKNSILGSKINSITKEHTGYIYFTDSINELQPKAFQYRVNSILITNDILGNLLVKFTIGHVKPGEIGDKFEARGQKGSLGSIWNQEDLPFNSMGMQPDVIINPHGIPSRMTIGFLFQLGFDKVKLYDSNFKEIDLSSFADFKVEELQKKLFENGFHSSNKERFYDGLSGELITDPINVGLMNYGRLAHFSANKKQQAEQAAISFNTKQPVRGKKNNGVVRFGEMEAQTIASEGGAHTLYSKFTRGANEEVQIKQCKTCLDWNDPNASRCRKCQSMELSQIFNVTHSAFTIEENLYACGIKLKPEYVF